MANKAQMFLIISVIFITIILLFLIFNMYIASKAQYQKEIRERNIELLKYNIKQIVETYRDRETNLTIKDMIVYASITNDDYFSNINIRSKIESIFNDIFENRWRIEVIYIPKIEAWLAKAYFDQLVLWNWDTSIYKDPKDDNGNLWYELEYDDSNWIFITLPLYQGDIVEDMLGVNIKDCIDINKELDYIPKGVYLCKNNKINPFQLYEKFEACTYRGDTEKPHIGITNDLPADIDYMTFGYIVLDGYKCNLQGRSREVNDEVYKRYIYYNTVTKIDEIAKNFVNSSYFATYFRGKFFVPEYCSSVYLEAMWNELLKLYINGQFLFANCYNSKDNPPKWKLEDRFCKPVQTKTCIKGTPTWGIVRANITEYIKKEEENLVSMFFGVPHDVGQDPECYEGISKDYDVSINTIGAVRIFCLDSSGNLYELNQETILPPKVIDTYGNEIPENKEIFSITIPYYIDVSEISSNRDTLMSITSLYIKIYIW